MAVGRDLNSKKVAEAITFNRQRFKSDFIRIIQGQMSVPANGNCDEVFVKSVADWQESKLAAGAGDGKVGHVTESMLNILLPEAQKAADAAKALARVGNILFDSWGNDARDNNGNGTTDDATEQGLEDGSHFHGTFPSFWVRTGHWDLGYSPRPTTRITIAANQEFRGPFSYRVCADMVSEAYHRAGVMRHVRRVHEIVDNIEKLGRLWHRSTDRYPSRYLPGDLIAVLESRRGGGHCGMVVEASDTNAGDNGPKVFELPGPSWESSDGVYDPRSTNDAKIRIWARHTFNSHNQQFLGRLLHTKFHPGR